MDLSAENYRNGLKPTDDSTNSSIVGQWDNLILVHNLINSSAINSLIYIANQVTTSCLSFIAYYTILKLAIIGLRILWRLKDDIYGIRSRLEPSADKAILITGGTSGIGLALAKYFYKRGFSIIVTHHSRRVPEELIEMQKCPPEIILGSDRPKMFFIHLDATSQDSIAKSYVEVKEILTNNNLSLHSLINNAGIAFYYKAFWMTRKQIEAIHSTNFLGPILLIRQYMPLLIKSPNSRIIHVGSGLAFFPVENCSIYSGLKAGIAHFMNSLAFELKTCNVKSVTVHVGNLMLNTSVLTGIEKDLEKVYKDFSPDELEIYREEMELHAKKLSAISSWVEGAGKGINQSQNILQRMNSNMFCYLAGLVKRNVKIEDSYTMKSFDNSICMVNPRKEVFAGNWLFTYFTGSFVESLDSVEKRAVGYIIQIFSMDQNLLSS